MAVRQELSERLKKRIGEIIDENTRMERGKYEPPLSTVYKQEIKPRYSKTQHKAIREFIRKQYASHMFLGGLRFRIGLFTSSGTTSEEAAAESRGAQGGMNDKQREKIIREWLEYWYNKWEDWDRVLSHANTEEGHNEMGLSPPPRPKEVQSVYRRLRGSMQSPDGSRESPETGSGAPVAGWGGAIIFSMIAPFILMMAVFTGGKFRLPTWLYVIAIIAALAGIYGWWRG